MAVRRKNARHRAATGVALIPQARGGFLRPGGGPGPGKPGPGRPDFAFRTRARFYLEKAKGLETVATVLSGDILEFLGQRDGALIVGNTRNADRLKAFELLRDSAGFGPKHVVIGPDAEKIEFTIKLRDDG